MSDPHDWNSWENYLHIHESRLAEHPFVRESLLAWTAIGDPVRSLSLDGTIVCTGGILVSVHKVLDARSVHGHLEVRGTRYAYNAYLPQQWNILRYDNGHADANEFHRHEFDLATGVEHRRDVITRAEMPTLADFLTEVQEMVGA